MYRAKLNTERWKRQSAGHRADAPCSSVLYVLLPFSFSLLTLLASCNEPFNPMQQNNLYPFSIHGYLDASQDTNWVRITAVRDSLFLDSPEPLDAVVTLEHLESGHTVKMNDSLFRYIPANTYAYNFWTDMNIEPEQTYRLNVRRSDGVVSSITVTLPSEFTDPYFMAGTRPFRVGVDTLFIRNVQYLADVEVLYHVVFHVPRGDVPRILSFRHLSDTLANGSIHGRQVRINTGPHFAAFAGMDPLTILKRKVKVSSAGPDWLNFSALDKNLISLPEGTSNVEGGTGYLIGIVSNTIEWPME